MDLQQLSSLFSLTLNADPNIRKKAELDIRKIQNEDGLITALLQIIATDSVDIATRQSCAVWVKNRVFTHYPADGRRGDMSAADCQSLRTHLLPIIANAPSRPIALQLANSFKNAVTRDFPTRWPGLLDEIKRLLNSGEIREVHAGCIAALEAVRGFRYLNNAQNLHSIVAQLFPILVSIATNMLQTPPSASEEIPAMLHLILKTYRTSTAMSLSEHQRSAESLVPWGQLLFAVVQLQIPADAIPADEDAREASEWWKTKKWAYAILGRLFHRYGNPSQLPSAMKEYKGFAEHFVNVFAPEILNIYLHQVELFVSGQAWLSPKCQYHIFTFFNECIKPKSTWSLLKPHFTTLVSTFIFPQLSFTPARAALWESDPIDYVRLSVDEYENYATPVSAATTFLFGLASNRTNTTFEPILSFVNGVLQSGVRDEEKFGALNMLAALGPWMMKHPKVKGNMEALVMQHVTPSLTSEKAYLRAIACELVGTLVKNKMQITNEPALHTIFTTIFALLDDPEFPVKVQACLALTELIVAFDSVEKAVAPQVAKVIQDVLRLSDESELDILNHSMEVLVDTYQTELLPVASQLAQRLCESYLRLVRETIAADDQAEGMDLETMVVSGEDDKTFHAMGIAKTIWTVISSVDSSPEILKEVQEVVIPIITFTLEHKFLDLFDSMYDLVDSLTFKLRAVSPAMWRVFELTHNLFKSDAVDYLEEMLPSLDNFVSFGSAVIQQRPDYKQMLIDIYATSITNEHLGENDRVNGCKLAESILLNLRGSVDEALQPIIQTAFAHIEEAETASLKLAMLEVLINAVLYNPSAALHLMEATAPGNARLFFDKWFAAINSDDKLPRVHDKRLSLLTLSALLEMDPSGIPESVKDGWPGLLGGALKLFKEYPEAVKARKAIEEAIEDDEEDDDPADEKYLNLTNDDDDVWDEDSAYLEMLANEGARLREKSAKITAGGEAEEDFEDIDDDDDDDDDDEIEEEIGYYSALDNINPYTSFQQALTAFQMKNPAAYQTATTALTMEQQTGLMEVVKIAETAVVPVA